MTDSAFGVVVRALRERRELSLRELGLLVGIDHAYISKIERGEKEPPPEETYQRLTKQLKPNAHELALLNFLYSATNVNPELALHVLDDPTVTPDVLAIAISVVHRGTARPTPTELIARAKRAKQIMEGR